MKKHKEDPIKKVLKVNNRTFKFQKVMNDVLVKILKRYELDKPILMQDKLDMIWDKSEKKVVAPKAVVELTPEEAYENLLKETMMTPREAFEKK